METGGSNNNFGKQTQDLADKAAEKVQSGIRTAKDSANQMADRLSDTVEGARSGVPPMIGKAADQTQAVANRTLDSLGSATKKVQATVADVGESVISYTQDNPVKAILISATVGILIGALATTWNRTSR
jgi:ElaB/YqjD/DUF883 family membrane-anchored ribosome-binding protein